MDTIAAVGNSSRSGFIRDNPTIIANISNIKNVKAVIASALDFSVNLVIAIREAMPANIKE